MHSKQLFTINHVPGRTVECSLGLVRGNAVRARHLGRDILSGVRMVTGGELADYTKLLGEVREQALDRLVADAEVLGADAVIGLRFQTCEIARGVAEMLAYGTAVKLVAPGETAAADRSPGAAPAED